MKTIEEAIEDIKKHLIDLCEAPNYEEDNYAAGYIAAIDEKTSELFKAGVEFAQDWIPVNKELPEWYTGCRLDILVKRETFNYPASVKIHTIYSDKDIQELKEMYTHWRLIDFK
jgi:hypothetical protein